MLAVMKGEMPLMAERIKAAIAVELLGVMAD